MLDGFRDERFDAISPDQHYLVITGGGDVQLLRLPIPFTQMVLENTEENEIRGYLPEEWKRNATEITSHNLALSH